MSAVRVNHIGIACVVEANIFGADNLECGKYGTHSTMQWKKKRSEIRSTHYRAPKMMAVPYKVGTVL